MAKIDKTPADDLQDILDAIGSEDGAQLLGSDALAQKILGIIPTGIPGIDMATGRGGVPLGRLTMLRGAEGSGKTTLALHIVSECQRMGGVAIYIDVEYKLDPDYAVNVGVDTSKLIIVQPSHLERVFKIIDSVVDKMAEKRKATKNRTPVLVILDSMNAAITKSELQGDWDDIHVSPQARVYSRLLPKLIPTISRQNIALVFISQERSKIGISYGDASTTAGGKAPPFYASLIMKVTPIGNEKDDGERVANKVIVECVKNQVAPPFKKASCTVVYGRGFDKERSLIDLAIDAKVVKKKGAFFSFGDVSLGQGFVASADALRGNDDLKNRIIERINAKKKIRE